MPRTGIEAATLRTLARRSDQLSYAVVLLQIDTAKIKLSIGFSKNGNLYACKKVYKIKVK